jgi:hypothetical protein
MKNFDETQLTQFIGTTGYFRISRRHLLTDGTKYLAEEAECFWMMDAIASHLSEIGTEDWFVQVRMTVTGNRATMIYEDGSGSEHARQEIPLYGLSNACHFTLCLLGRRALGDHAA